MSWFALYSSVIVVSNEIKISTMGKYNAYHELLPDGHNGLKRDKDLLYSISTTSSTSRRDTDHKHPIMNTSSTFRRDTDHKHSIMWVGLKYEIQ